MSVKNRLLISSAICLILVLGAGLIVIFQFNAVEDQLHRLRTNSAIVRNVFNLDILADDYANYNEERPVVQWRLTHDTLRKLLQEAAERNSHHPGILNRLIENHREIDSTFSDLVGLHEKDSFPPEESPLKKEVGQKLKGLLSVKLQSMVDHASRLESASQAKLAHSQKVATLTIMVFVALMAGIAVGTGIYVYRLIIAPLQKLADAADVVGAGVLDRAVDVTGPGELGHLAKAFNRMTANLKKSYEELGAEVSQRKLAEKVLAKQAEELARSNRELGQFAYVASHDLQEPLRNVTNCVQLLERRYKDRIGPDAVKLTDFAADSCSRMKTLIDDLLEFSRVGTRGKALEPTDCELVLRQALANIGSLIDESRAVITHDPMPTLNADSTQLSQLFQNLVSNGIKFRGEEPPRIHVSAEKNDHEWLFSVRDNGIGIDPQYNDRIFVIFQRLHAKSDFPGSGIGLAIAKKIVERHGGRIWTESAGKGGAIFYFTIPTGVYENGH
ncbi:MAG: HAMP domain-containing protein [Desulfomonile tiedjei]|nr:HAMP domain-containing protein [Desulfomonile tiedjei]